MQICKLPSCGVFDQDQVKILAAALDEALRLSEINDRSELRAASVAQRIITTFMFAIQTAAGRAFERFGEWPLQGTIEHDWLGAPRSV